MRYELTIIAPEKMTVLDKIKLESTIEKYATILKSDKEKHKRLLYPLEGKEWAIYLYYELEMDKDEGLELDNELCADINVMRLLLVHKTEEE